MASQIKVGTITGTGAAVNVEIGWIPDAVIVLNATDGDVVDLWFNGMTAATSVKIDTAAATRAASDGISTYAGSSTPGSQKRQGFTIGAGISESAKVLYYAAFRNMP